MRTSLRILLAALPSFGMSACLAPEGLDPAAPAEIAWMALYAEPTSEARAWSTPMFAPTEPTAFNRRDAQTVWAFGWPTEALAPFSEDELRSEEIHATSDCRQPLPEPSWISALEGSSSVMSPKPEAPFHITTDWLDAKCPELSDPESADSDFVVDSSCQLRYCLPRISQKGCRLELDLSPCIGNQVDSTGWIDHEGELCVETPNCQTIAPGFEDESLLAAIDCDEVCTSLVYYRPEPLAVELARASVADPVGDSLGRDLTINLAKLGSIADLIVQPDRIGLLTLSGNAGGVNCPDGNAERVLRFIDPETLETISTSTVPPCTSQLLGVGDELYAATTPVEAGTELEIFRLAADGQLLDRRRITLPPGRSGQAAWTVELAYLEDTDELVVLASYRFAVDIEDRQAELRYFDRSLEPTRSVVLERILPISLRVARNAQGQERLVTVDSRKSGLVQWFAPGADQAELGLNSDTPGLAMNSFQLLAHPVGPESALVLFGSDQPQSAFARNPTPSLPAVFGFFEAEGAAGTAVGPHPFDGRLWFTAFRARPTVTDELGTAYLTLFDADRERLRPGAIEIGHGVVIGGEPGPRGRLWFALPWTGEVLRVTVAP